MDLRSRQFGNFLCLSTDSRCITGFYPPLSPSFAGVAINPTETPIVNPFLCQITATMEPVGQRTQEQGANDFYIGNKGPTTP